MKYWLSRLAASFATQIQTVAVGWQVYDLTRDPLDLGFVGLSQFLPALLLVLVTGAVADRFDRRTHHGGLPRRRGALRRRARSLFTLTRRAQRSADLRRARRLRHRPAPSTARRSNRCCPNLVPPDIARAAPSR